MNRPRVAIVDHSYHAKTKSTEFLFDLFREFFEVDVFWDESWKSRKDRFSMGGMPVRGDYEWIVFLQVFPPPGIFRFLKCKNILCVPMLDGMIGVPPEYFSRLRNCYFLSFSRTLHGFLTELGHRSFYLQYFPKVGHEDDFVKKSADDNSGNAAFFWQRREPVTSQVVSALLGESSSVSKLHVHLKSDPGFEYLEDAVAEFPSDLELTTSTWLETREEFHQLVARSGIFFAPREYEGIGMSFLEALGLGKCVVSPDRPTANEYIEHGVNGLLYDPADPKPLDLTDVMRIRENALSSSIEGRQKFLSEAERFMRNLVGRELSLFGEFRLAAIADSSNGSDIRQNESLELIREQTSSPWVFRTAKRYLSEIMCLLGLILTRLTGGRERGKKE